MTAGAPLIPICGLRVYQPGPLRAFAANQPMTQMVDDIDPSTGRPTRPKLVSVRVDRETFQERDLSHPQLDPERALKGLKANFSPGADLKIVMPGKT